MQHLVHEVVTAPEHRNIQRARDDRNVRGRRSLFQNHALQFPAVVVEQFRRAHVPRHQDGVVRQFTGQLHLGLPQQVTLQSVGEIVEIRQPLAQIGIGNLPHPSPGVVLHFLHGRLGGEAGLDRLYDSIGPTAVLREHAIGLEHFAMFAAGSDVARRQHLVKRQLHGAHGVVEPLDLLQWIFGYELGDRNVRPTC